MDYIRPAAERGHVNFGWLDSYHSFSFGNYHDPRHTGFSALRVINEDTIAGGTGFDTHPHRDMEIITYILAGTIEHRDSLGNRFTIGPGEVQRMSAGTGIAHSEYNASPTEPLHLLQIWLLPRDRGITPGYEQVAIPQRGALTPLVTPDGRDGSLTLHQDAALYRLRLPAGGQERLATGARAGYLHLVRGSATAGEQRLGAGDGIGLIQTRELDIRSDSDDFEALWFDLPTFNH